jgi:hypothetical protein
MSEEFFYTHGELSIEAIQAEIAKFWAELNADTEIQSELAGVGLAPDAFLSIDLDQAITVRADSSGADPTSVLLIVALAPTANNILKDVWKTVLLPRIRRRWGQDAIGQEHREK